MIRSVLIVAACSADPAPIVMARVERSDCVDPRDLGAGADDIYDDRVALVASAEAAARDRTPICLPPGVLLVTRGPGPNSITLDGVSMFGEGPSSSQLVMMGGSDGGNWRVLRVTGQGTRLSGFSIDGSNREATTEQTHLIQVDDGARDVQIDHLELVLPTLPGMLGGDCVRLLGEASAEVRRVSISDVAMPACARSGVSFQRGVRGVWIDRLTTLSIGGQAIDMEPTGDGTIGDVSIRDSWLARGEAPGEFTIALAGTGTATAHDILLDRVTVLDGGVNLFATDDVTISNSSIEALPGKRAIKAIRGSRGIRLVDVRLVRPADPNPDAAGGPVAFFGGDSTPGGVTYPVDVEIRGGSILQHGRGNLIQAEPIDGLLVGGTSLDCAGPESGTYSAVWARGVGAPVENIRIAGALVRGNCKHAANLVEHGGNVTGPIIVTGSIIETTGAVANFIGTPRVPPVVANNVE